MSLYNVVNSASLQPGQPEDVSQVLANFQAIQAVLNGGIDDVNIRSTAAIQVSKLAGYPADATKALRGDGSWASVPPTGTNLATPGTGTYTVPAGVKYLVVRCWGAGGAGGGAPTTGAGQISIGGGGGAGGYVEYVISGAFLVATYTWTVGAGGVAVSGANGGNGGSTSFVGGTVNMVANGGVGGQASVAFTPPGNSGAIGLGGTATGGNYAARGQDGFVGIGVSTSSIFGGPGGMSPGGSAGGSYAGGSGVGIAGYLPGGGGSGAVRPPSAGNIAGGNGSGGMINIREYY